MSVFCDQSISNATSSAPPKPSNTKRTLRISETSAMVGGISNMTLLRWEKAGMFPKRFKANPLLEGTQQGIAYHDYDEVMKWLEARHGRVDTATGS